MFKLIRRISYGVIPRPDRPWEEDPTSNAPQRSKKRRLSSPEREDVDEEQSDKKKVRADSATPSAADAEATFLTPTPQVDTAEVKEVTQGVEEVDLDDTTGKAPEPASEDAAPETIPLPDEKSGELDEASSDADEASSSGSREDDVPRDNDAAPVALPSASNDDAEVPPSDQPSHDDDAAPEPIALTSEQPISGPQTSKD